MLGGCQKKMFYIKDTKSRLYSEAYFILRSGAELDYVCENDLAAEADRILREKLHGKKHGAKLKRLYPIVSFILGGVAGALLMLVI